MADTEDRDKGNQLIRRLSPDSSDTDDELDRGESSESMSQETAIPQLDRAVIKGPIDTLESSNVQQTSNPMGIVRNHDGVEATRSYRSCEANDDDRTDTETIGSVPRGKDPPDTSSAVETTTSRPKDSPKVTSSLCRETGTDGHVSKPTDVSAPSPPQSTVPERGRMSTAAAGDNATSEEKVVKTRTSLEFESEQGRSVRITTESTPAMAPEMAPRYVLDAAKEQRVETDSVVDVVATERPSVNVDKVIRPPSQPRIPNGGLGSMSPSLGIPTVEMQPNSLSLMQPHSAVGNPQRYVSPSLQYAMTTTHGMPPVTLMTAAPPVPSAILAGAAPAPMRSGRRRIRLRLQEDVDGGGHRRMGSSFFRRSFRNFHDSLQTIESEGVDRGSVTVSWFEGTSSFELQEHVKNCVIRKMGLSGKAKLADIRIIDESMDPPEEIVLSTFIPDGSHFLLRFSTREAAVSPPSPPNSRALRSAASSIAPPVSPSAAPSPFPSSSDLAGLNSTQLQTLGAHLKGLHPLKASSERVARRVEREEPENEIPDENGGGGSPVNSEKREESRVTNDHDVASRASTDINEEEIMSLSPEDQIESRLRQLTDLLLTDRMGKRQRRQLRRHEKKQVIFVLANYFVLFLSLIAISAEIQARAPRWMAWMEKNLETVQTCATDESSLFQCVSNGDFSGLIASFILWFGRSAATKRFFLFGFETPKRLWTVVYEALVTALCWGISYTFVRRGMNPDTRRNFLQKYWKDAVYGSLAGFNASFMKAVLKNLIPQEALEDALQDRQLKILSWLPSFS